MTEELYRELMVREKKTQNLLISIALLMWAMMWVADTVCSFWIRIAYS